MVVRTNRENKGGTCSPCLAHCAGKLIGLSAVSFCLCCLFHCLSSLRHFESNGTAYNQIGLKKVGSPGNMQQGSALAISGDGTSVLGPPILYEPAQAACATPPCAASFLLLCDSVPH